MISTKVYSQIQHAKMKITISGYAFILPYSRVYGKVIKTKNKGFESCLLI